MASRRPQGAPSLRRRHPEDDSGASPKSALSGQSSSHSPASGSDARPHQRPQWRGGAEPPGGAVRPQQSSAAARPAEARRPPAGQGGDAAEACEADSELPALWSAHLAGTLVAHTVQNAMRLASYLMRLLPGGYGTASALHIACWEGSVEAVSAIAAGSKIKMKEWHARPGRYYRAPTPKTKKPWEARADASAANNWGVTPLHLAAAHAALERVHVRDAESVLLLCRHHADAKALDKHGKSPADVARMAGGDASLIDHLLNHADGKIGAGQLPVLPREASGVGSPYGTSPVDEPADSDDSETLFSPSMLFRKAGGRGASRRDSKKDGQAAAKAAADRQDPGAVSPDDEVGGKSPLELARENEALAWDVARLSQVLEKSQSSCRLLEEQLEQSRETTEQMKGLASASQRQAEEREALRKQGGQEERRQLEEAQAAVQRQLADAVAALDRERRGWLSQRAELERQLATAQEEASVAASAELGRKTEELEEQKLAEDCFHTALDGKDAELRQKDAELEALRAELEQRRSELGAARGLASSQSTGLLAAEGELARLRGDLQRQAQERERTGERLSQLLAEHGEAKQQLAREAQRRGELEKSCSERELALKGQAQEELLHAAKLGEDVAELRGHLGEMEEWKRRAEEADRMLKPLEQRIEELRVSFNAEQGLRKRYHNQMQDLKGAIRVFARIRPRVRREAEEEVAVRKQDAFSLEIAAKDPKQPPKVFAFDSVFDERSTQDDVFAECRGLVSSAIDGFNVTVFAYGQTGAGKTHTMYGSEAAPGLVPRIADEIFDVLGRYSHECRAKVRCSMFELYRDDLVDLLLPRAKAKAPPPLEIKRDARGSVYVENAAEREAGGPLELLKAISDAQERRHVASTKMNADSSRSHLIFTIVIESVNKKTKQVATGKLTLCDLAGSERLKRTEVKGDQVKEAQSINKSLSALGDVIEALTKNSKHIPYRNHKLTQLLSDSLGGNAKTLMFVNCSPAAGNAEETGAALGYAARAKQIMNKVEKNQDSQEVARLKKVVQVMSQELELARSSSGGALPQLEPG